MIGRGLCGRHEIVGVLGLYKEAGMAVADIGAGTGLFTRLIAEKVRRRGRSTRSISHRSFWSTSRLMQKNAGESRSRHSGNQERRRPPADELDLVFLSDV